VLPGVLLSPIELLAIPRRLDVLTYAMVRAVSVGGRRHLKKDEVEVIREISAKLNQGEKDRLALSAFAIGQRVRFVSGLYAAFLGGGTILDIAKSGQVRVKIEGTLFGGQDQIIVPASELEAIESEPPALDAAPPSTQINSRR
jgi:transcription antitermination factor NusG